ncbi:MAG: signal peptidase I [Oscillospiraceae bacterium]|jgi:signal peptidase I|nr:signal peptidase I [Oscillospiraceae bacterium]
MMHEPGSNENNSELIKEIINANMVEKARKARMELYDWIQCIVTALICGILIFVFIGRTIGVDGSSMERTLLNNDRVIMLNLFYTPKNGDIIVFKPTHERFHNVPLVKRVIATEGQTLDIDFANNEIIVDGVVISEPYIRSITTSKYGFEGPITIKPGHVFVMGDNRSGSTDSRDVDVGQVDTRYILGKVHFILIPGESFGSPRDWNRFGFVH